MFSYFVECPTTNRFLKINVDSKDNIDLSISTKFNLNITFDLEVYDTQCAVYYLLEDRNELPDFPVKLRLILPEKKEEEAFKEELVPLKKNKIVSFEKK